MENNMKRFCACCWHWRGTDIALLCSFSICEKVEIMYYLSRIVA